MDKTIPKILLVDDERAILNDLSPFLKRNGYQVREAVNGSDALALVETFQPDVIILDVKMPRMGGFEVLRRLRAAHNQASVVLLTVINEPIVEALSLNTGADDYLSKPFHKDVLLARVRNVLRRSQSPKKVVRELISDDLRIDLVAHRVWFKGKELELTRRAFILLEFLLRHPDQLLTYETLMDTLWDWRDTSGAGHQAIRTRIVELRRALGDNPNRPQYIETVHGEGYRFIAPVRAS